MSKALASKPVTPHQGMVERIAELEAELAALRAQEPVAWMIEGAFFYLTQQRFRDGKPVPNQAPLYLAAGAKP